ncbi:neuromodulin [Parus major]|uniref:neuromodulin n=1 Tax=Parus major TaxID=9157 RepID=UPI0007713CE8|nr:neuromodulin [Parus major]
MAPAPLRVPGQRSAPLCQRSPLYYGTGTLATCSSAEPHTATPHGCGRLSVLVDGGGLRAQLPLLHLSAHREMRGKWDILNKIRTSATPEEVLTYLPLFSSALLPCSSSKVEKNEDGDQKIEQDGIKPEDKAHKAATKIQASFRGHITRKKLKGEKKGDAPASETDAADKKEEGPAGGAAENKESEAPAATEAADSAQQEEGSKDSSAPAEEKKGDGAADTGSEQPAPQAATPAASSEEKPAAAAAPERESATKASTDNSPSLKADEAQDKEEPKQADVPAADTTATTTPAAEDATAKATAQPQMETVESSQTEEKTDAVEETKPTESAQQEEVKEEESKADQENA